MIHPINRGIVAGVLASLLAGCAVIDAQEAKDLTTEWRTATYYPMGRAYPVKAEWRSEGVVDRECLVDAIIDLCGGSDRTNNTYIDTYYRFSGEIPYGAVIKVDITNKYYDNKRTSTDSFTLSHNDLTTGGVRQGRRFRSLGATTRWAKFAVAAPSRQVMVVPTTTGGLMAGTFQDSKLRNGLTLSADGDWTFGNYGDEGLINGVYVTDGSDHTYWGFQKYNDRDEIVSEYSALVDALVEARGWSYPETTVRDLVSERIGRYLDGLEERENNFTENVSNCLTNKLGDPFSREEEVVFDAANTCYNEAKQELLELANLAEVPPLVPEESEAFKAVAELNGVDLEAEKIAEQQRLAEQRRQERLRQEEARREEERRNAQLRGRYVNGGDWWIFGESTGEFWQTQSINGQPGKIVIYFDYELNGSTLRYTQTRIELRDHPSARSQSLNKPFTEQVRYGPGFFEIGGKTFRK